MTAVKDGAAARSRTSSIWLGKPILLLRPVAAALALLLGACELFFPPALSVRVRRSELLQEYADRPLWQWSVDGAGTVGRLQVSLDHGRYRELPPAARSYRAPAPLAPGRHVLTVRAQVGGRSLGVGDRAGSRPAGVARRNPGHARGRWWLEQIRLPAVWQAFAGGRLPAPRPVIVAVLDGGYLPHPGPERRPRPRRRLRFRQRGPQRLRRGRLARYRGCRRDRRRCRQRLRGRDGLVCGYPAHHHRHAGTGNRREQ